MPENFNGEGPEYLVGNDTRGGTSGDLDSFTIEGAGGYIVRGSTGWGAGVTVSFAFRNSEPADMPDDTSGFSKFNAAQIAQTLLALQSWSDVANVNFSRVGGSGYSDNASMLFGNYSDGAEGAAAFAYYPGYYPGGTDASDSAGDAWFNSTLEYNTAPALLNYGRHTLVHEIGHALGLDHPGDYNAGDGDEPITYENSADYREDSGQYTVMSYFSEGATGAAFGADAAAPLLDDITAVQLLYGANMTTRTGNTTYGFNSNTDRDFYSLSNSTDKAIFCVWDAGGTDTLDFSGYSMSQTIDLRCGEFSSVGGLRYNVSIAQGAFIEKGIGGSGSDTMYASYYATPVAVADLTKAQGTNNHSTGNAVSLNGKFGLVFDNAIVSSTVIPHATVNAVGDGSRDYYAVTVTAGQQITIDIDGTASALDAYVSIVNGSGTVLKFNDDGMTDIGSSKEQDSYLTYTFTSSGTFYIAVGSYPDVEEGEEVPQIGDGIGAGQAYTLNVSLTGAPAPTTGTVKGSALNGGAGDDILYGNIGNDTLTGGFGIDSMRGGKGNDIYYVDHISDSPVEAKSEGTDLVYSSVSFTLGASSYVEQLTLTGSANLNGTGNNIDNVITGNAGINVLTGAKGDDVYYVQNTGDTAVEVKGQGTDLVYASVSFTLGASSYVERLTLTGSANLNGTGNNIDNVLTGNTGVNVLTGYKGDDVYYVQNTGDKAIEVKDQGTDLVYASVSFTLGASSYVEQLTLTGSGNINGTGNNIANVLTGNSGINVLTGAKGDDVYYVQNTGDTAIEVKGQGTDLVYSSVSFTLGASSYVENLTLTGSANTNGTGNGIANLIRGNTGNNSLDGGKGDDRLYGGSGNDTLNGGVSGADKMAGEAGNDTYYVNSSDDVLYEDKGEGTDLVYSSASFTLGASSYVENLTLTGSANINGTGNGIANLIRGNSGNNTLDGGKGDDRLYGGSGNDTLNGGVSGADKMAGEAGNDTYYVNSSDDLVYEDKGEGTDLIYASATFTLGASSYVENLTLTGSGNINGAGNGIDNVIVGNSGANKIDGLKGQDTLTGGGGADTFVWSATSHSTVSAADRITDLSNSDFIDLSAIDANVNTGGTQHFVLVDAFTNTAGQVTLSYNGTYTTLNADTNGDGVSDMLIRIDGNHTDFDNFIFGGG